LLTKGGLVLTGPEIEKLSDQELGQLRRTTCKCVAGFHPSTRRESSMPKARDHVVAMTGDGVNTLRP